ncbi:MAG: tyrosine-type recombinase/integrase [Sphingomonadaceae bacterium]
MPLSIYLRGTTYWARGRITHQGQSLGEYVRCSTGASDEAGAWAWCREEEARRVRRFLVGDEHALTFAEAVLLYESDPKTAKYLIPIVQEIGSMSVATITPRMVRELGAKLYPVAGTATWTRQVVSPIRAVINNAHDLGKCAPIRVKGFPKSEKVAQDKKRGSNGRSAYPPGSWEWILTFRKHADRRVGALALFMFVTGARIGQATAMHPGKHLDLQNARACVPGAKGQPDRWLKIPMELVADLANLPRLWPRGWKRTNANLRVFGYADRTAPRKAWNSAIKAAGIEFIPFHSAGRHGFGQEMNVRRGVDEKAAGSWGGWSDTNLMRRTYTHAEAVEAKMHEAFYEGLREAEDATGFSLVGSRNAA